MQTRGQRKQKTGIVISNKMQKTITVRVERLIRHPRYKKYVRRYTNFKAHDEENNAQIGDQVEIMETRPLSKTKRWRLVKIIKRKGGEFLVKKGNEHDLSANQARSGG
jgi:small subunit ribosomal protein S17